jgi:hypothetical protein
VRLLVTVLFMTALFMTVLLAPAGSEQCFAAEEQLELIAGDMQPGPLREITAAGDVLLSGTPKTWPLAQLRSWQQIARKGTTREATLTVQGRHGLRASPQDVRFNGDTFLCTWADGLSVPLPFDAVRSVAFSAGPLPAQWQTLLEQPPREQDRLFIQVGEGNTIETLDVLLAEITAEQVSFEVGGNRRSIARAKVRGVVLADAGTPPTPIALATLLDGSRLPIAAVSFREQQWQLRWTGASESVSLARESVVRIDFHSPALKFVSDLTPVTVREETVFTLPAPWQRDRSCGGHPLTLAGRVYDRGLGVHARSELVFEVPAGARLLLATLGIDDAAARVAGTRTPLGHCEYVVLGDGRELFRQRVRGGEAPFPLRLELPPVRQVTLLVEPGEDFDFADHANWCDARFILRLP